MGQRIAFSCILGGHATKIFDSSPGVTERAVEAVRVLIGEWIATGRLPSAAASRMELLSVAGSLQDCVGGVDLVIETVPENVELKKQVFAEIDRYLGPNTLLSTNTSSIPGSWLAPVTRCPERVFNANWGTLKDLKVEVMGHAKTAPETLNTAVEFLRVLGLVPIVDKGESVGYATNRVWRAVKKEVLKVLDSGMLTAEEVDRAWMLDWGTPIGPCGLMDKVGLDVVRDIEMIYYEASGDPSDPPPPILQRMIAEGKLGMKTGQGFYTYPNPAYQREGFLKGQSTVGSKL
jgi:3-hydroxybutyryl-CoA dehydrogenase